MPGGLAVATQQTNRAQDQERELRQHQQRRHGWLEANAQLGLTYRSRPGAGGPGAKPPPRSSSTGAPTRSLIRTGPSGPSRLTPPSERTGNTSAQRSSESTPSSAPPTAPATPSRSASATPSCYLASSVAGEARSGPPARSATGRRPPWPTPPPDGSLRRRRLVQRVGATAQPVRPPGHPRPPR
jgi:hypothetical protein